MLWLPVNRGNYGIDLIIRIHAPDLERYKTWSPLGLGQKGSRLPAWPGVGLSSQGRSEMVY